MGVTYALHYAKILVGSTCAGNCQYLRRCNTCEEVFMGTLVMLALHKLLMHHHHIPDDSEGHPLGLWGPALECGMTCEWHRVSVHSVRVSSPQPKRQLEVVQRCILMINRAYRSNLMCSTVFLLPCWLLNGFAKPKRTIYGAKLCNTRPAERVKLCCKLLP